MNQVYKVKKFGKPSDSGESSQSFEQNDLDELIASLESTECLK